MNLNKALSIFICVLLLTTIGVNFWKNIQAVSIHGAIIECFPKYCIYEYELRNSSKDVQEGNVVIIFKSKNFQARSSSGIDRGRIKKHYKLSPGVRILYQGTHDSQDNLDAYFRLQPQLNNKPKG